MPKGAYTADAALAAVLSYNNLYQQQFAGTEKTVHKKTAAKGKGKRQEEDKPDYAPREFTPLEGGMLKAFQRYVCFVPNSEDLATMKYPVYSPDSGDPSRPIGTPVGFLLPADGVLAVLLNRRDSSVPRARVRNQRPA